MPRRTHYPPCIKRDLVRVLYHEARHRRMPMTRLVDELLSAALSGTSGWHSAHDTCVLQETPPTDHKGGVHAAA